VALVIAAGSIGVWRSEIFRTHVEPESLRLSAQLAANVLSVFGERAISIGPAISSPRMSLLIGTGCDATLPLVVFVAAVLACPVGARRKATGILGGAALMLITNQVRIVSLYYASIHAPAAFDVLHRDVWQGAFVLIAVAGWSTWALHALGERQAAIPQRSGFRRGSSPS